MRQTARLESAVLGFAGDRIRVVEVVSIELMGWAGVCDISLCLAETPEGSVLVVHVAEDVPSFLAVALGPAGALLDRVRHVPELVLPRVVESSTGDLVRVILRERAPWGGDDVIAVVTALTGFVAQDEYLARRDLLDGPATVAQAGPGLPLMPTVMTA